MFAGLGRQRAERVRGLKEPRPWRRDGDGETDDAEASRDLRHKLELGHSHRQTARALGISAGTVASAATRVKALGMTWAAVCVLDDEALETRLYGPPGARRDGRPMPDPARLDLELRRTGVTLSLLHLEYLEQHPSGYRYTAFC